MLGANPPGLSVTATIERHSDQVLDGFRSSLQQFIQDMKGQTAQVFSLSDDEADQVTLKTIDQLLQPLSNDVEACIENYKKNLDTQLPQLLKQQISNIENSKTDRKLDQLIQSSAGRQSQISQMTGFNASRLSQYQNSPQVAPFDQTFRPIDLSNGIREAKMQLDSRSKSAGGTRKKRKPVDLYLQTKKKLTKLMKSEPNYDGRTTGANEIWAQLKPWTPEFLQTYWDLVETGPQDRRMPMIDLENAKFVRWEDKPNYHAGMRHKVTVRAHGVVRTCFPDGVIHEGTYKNGKRHGLFRWIGPDGIGIYLCNDGIIATIHIGVSAEGELKEVAGPKGEKTRGGTHKTMLDILELDDMKI